MNLFEVRGSHANEIHTVILWDMAPSSLVGGYQRFGGTSCRELEPVSSEWGNIIYSVQSSRHRNSLQPKRMLRVMPNISKHKENVVWENLES
jgi:hypothetical protein